MPKQRQIKKHKKDNLKAKEEAIRYDLLKERAIVLPDLDFEESLLEENEDLDWDVFDDEDF